MSSFFPFRFRWAVAHLFFDDSPPLFFFSPKNDQKPLSFLPVQPGRRREGLGRWDGLLRQAAVEADGSEGERLEGKEQQQQRQQRQ